MTNTLTMTAAHLTILSAKGIIEEIARTNTSTDAVATINHVRAISATIDGRVGAAVDKLGMEQAVAVYTEERRLLSNRQANRTRKAA